MRLVVPLLAAILSFSSASAQEWSQVSSPSPGPTQVVGFYSAGCIQGAQALPTEGPGYVASRLSRYRNWGHPVTLDFIQNFSDEKQVIVVNFGLPGDWYFDAFSLSSSVRSTLVPSYEEIGIGFRLATVVVPEPSTWVMGLAGIACGGYSLFRRRRAR